MNISVDTIVTEVVKFYCYCHYYGNITTSATDVIHCRSVPRSCLRLGLWLGSNCCQSCRGYDGKPVAFFDKWVWVKKLIQRNSRILCSLTRHIPTLDSCAYFNAKNCHNRVWGSWMLTHAHLMNSALQGQPKKTYKKQWPRLFELNKSAVFLSTQRRCLWFIFRLMATRQAPHWKLQRTLHLSTPKNIKEHWEPWRASMLDMLATAKRMISEVIVQKPKGIPWFQPNYNTILNGNPIKTYQNHTMQRGPVAWNAFTLATLAPAKAGAGASETCRLWCTAWPQYAEPPASMRFSMVFYNEMQKEDCRCLSKTIFIISVLGESEWKIDPTLVERKRLKLRMWGSPMLCGQPLRTKGRLAGVHIVNGSGLYSPYQFIIAQQRSAWTPSNTDPDISFDNLHVGNVASARFQLLYIYIYITYIPNPNILIISATKCHL